MMGSDYQMISRSAHAQLLHRNARGAGDGRSGSMAGPRRGMIKHGPPAALSPAWSPSTRLGEMVHWSALARWHETANGPHRRRYQPDNLQAALKNPGGRDRSCRREA